MSMLWHPIHQECGLAFHADYNFEWSSLDLRIVKRLGDGTTLRGEMEFVKHNPGERMEPTLRCRDREDGGGLQDLFNCLWDAGLRPPSGVDPEPIVQAKNENLTDLRRILDKMMDL
jgi:hypothetical protein